MTTCHGIHTEFKSNWGTNNYPCVYLFTIGFAICNIWHTIRQMILFRIWTLTSIDIDHKDLIKDYIIRLMLMLIHKVDLPEEKNTHTSCSDLLYINAFWNINMMSRRNSAVLWITFKKRHRIYQTQKQKCSTDLKLCIISQGKGKQTCRISKHSFSICCNSE